MPIKPKIKVEKRAAPVKSFISPSRLESFSDGVFVIILTLLVLDLHVPKITNPSSATQLTSALKEMIPNFKAFTVSFFTICIIWLSHHRIFKGYTIIPYPLFMINALFLFFACLIPFPTSLIGMYPNNPVTVFLYGILLFCLMLCFLFLRLYSLKNTAILTEEYKENTPLSLTVKAMVGQIISPVFSPLIAAFISYNYPNIGVWLYAFIILGSFFLYSRINMLREVKKD